MYREMAITLEAIDASLKNAPTLIETLFTNR
jgi:hypothetical protein